MGKLAGKVAVVLGCSAERGSGWAIAEALAGEGAKVVVAARRLPPLQRLAAKIGGKAVVCDAGDEKQIAALAGAAVEAYGRVDIAVNVAAYACVALIDNAEADDIMTPMRVNYLGNVGFVKHMARAIGTDGSIIIISSSSAQNTMVPFFPYACSKAAVDCLVRYAALEYGPKRIRVNSILPSAIRSEMSADFLSVPGTEQALVKEVPLGRIGEPADFADAVLWLAGPAYVTGLNLPVSGGAHLTRAPYAHELPAGKDVKV